MHAQHELGNNVVAAHIWSIDIVRAKNNNPVKMLATVVDGKHLADDLGSGVGIPRIERVREW